MAQRVKQFLVLFLSMAISAGALAGCGNSAVNKEPSAMGRFVEEDVELPMKDSKGIISLSKSAEGNPLLFVSGGAYVDRYEYQEGKWESTEVNWAAEVFKNKPIYVTDAEEASDGTQIMLVLRDNNKYSMVRGKEGEEPKELNVPYLEQKTDNGYPSISDIQIDGEGNYWLQDGYLGKVVVIDSQSLELTMETEESDTSIGSNGLTNKVMSKGNDGSIAVTLDGVCTVYSGKSPEKTGTLDTGESAEIKYSNDGSSWFGISQNGISKNQLGNDISEILMDSGSGIMGTTLYIPASMVCISEEEFYVLYFQNDETIGTVKRYVYDKEIPSVPVNKLTVFGMDDNATIRQAITGFQKENPDIVISFNTAEKEGQEITTDDLRTLNTELLGGDGADILLLDGLPADSYIEKGILEDMSDLTEELLEQDTYLETMMKNTAEKDGKIYGLPTKFKIPVIYGDEQIQKALDSVDTLEAYMEENPEASIFGVSTSDYIRNILFMKFQDEIVQADKKINQEKLARLLELEKQICENAQTEEYDGNVYNSNIPGESLKYQEAMFTNPMGIGLVKFPNAVSTDGISGVASMMVPCAVMKQVEAAPVSFENMYEPTGVVAINSQSGQKELAAEFVKYLFSETIQSALTEDGLPVLETALQKKTKETSRTMVVSGADINGEQVMVKAGYPSESEIQSLVDLSETLTKPVKQDRIIWNLYREMTDKYLEGSIDAAEAAESIAQKVDTYLAE